MKKYFLTILIGLISPFFLSAATSGQVLGTYYAGPWPQMVRFEPYTNLIWALKGDGYTPQNWIKFNPTTGAVVGDNYPASDPYIIAYDATSNIAWDFNLNTSQVRKIVASTGAVLNSFVLSSLWSTPGIIVDIPTNTLWYFDGSVRKASATTGATLNTYTVNAPDARGIARDSAGFIWVVDFFNNSLLKLNPSNGAVTSYYLGDTFPPSGIVFDPTTNSLWVTNGNWTYGYIQKMNLSGGVIGTYYVSDLLGSVAFDSFTNSLWVANSNQTTISKLGNGFTNTAPSATVTIPTGSTTVTQGTTVAFSGIGSDTDPGDSITAYEWREGNCSTGTLLSSASSFILSTPTVSVGRTIFFRVQDSHGAWSTNCPSRTITVTAAFTVPIVSGPTATSITTTGATLGATVISLGVVPDGTLSGRTDYATTGGPYGIAISPDGTSVYVTNPGFIASPVASLYPRNTSTGVLSAKTDYATGSSPFGVEISPDGAWVYVVSTGSNMISRYARNLSTGALSGKTDYTTGMYPGEIAISPDGTSVYVTNSTAGTVSMYVRSVLTGALSAKTDYVTGPNLYDITVSPDGASVYVTSFDSDTLSMYTRNTSTGTLSGKTDYATGMSPADIVISPDGTSVYIANFGSDNISLYSRNTSTGALSAKTDYTTGSTPYDVDISSDGTSVYVTNWSSNTVSMYARSTLAGSLSGRTDYPTGVNPYSVTVSSDGTSVYVTNFTSRTVSKYTRNITNGTLTARGVCYSVLSNPSLVNGAACVAAVLSQVIPGVYTVPVAGLTPNTLYHYRGYATNSTGTGYSTDGTFTTPSAACVNNAINPPTCDQCPANYSYYLASCVVCSNGGCTGPGGSTSNPNGGLVCNNGALNPPFCNSCPIGKTFSAGSCVANCINGAIDPPTCIACPGGQTLILGSCVATPACNNNSVCNAGETPITCPKDCKVKFRQF